jgi:hypothetical protein
MRMKHAIGCVLMQLPPDAEPKAQRWAEAATATAEELDAIDVPDMPLRARNVRPFREPPFPATASTRGPARDLCCDDATVP